MNTAPRVDAIANMRSGELPQNKCYRRGMVTLPRPVVKNAIALKDKKSFKYKIKGRLLFEGGSFVPSYVRFESEEDLKIKGLMERQD